MPAPLQNWRLSWGWWFVADGSVAHLQPAHHPQLAPDKAKLTDGLSRRCVIRGVGSECARVLQYLQASPYTHLREQDSDSDEQPDAGGLLRDRAALAEAEWLLKTGHQVEPALVEGWGALRDPRGHNPPVSLVREPNDPDDDWDFGDLPYGSVNWSETLAGVLTTEPREPNSLPVLPPWATPRFRAFLETARLTEGQIRKWTRSRSLAARRICEHAEALASSFTLDDNTKARSVTDARARAILCHLLALADEVLGVVRDDDSRFRARLETVRQLKKSKRRSEMLDIYRELLRPASDRDQARRVEIIEIYAEECRPRTQPRAHDREWFWKPTNKANPRGCNETPVPSCANTEGHRTSRSNENDPDN